MHNFTRIYPCVFMGLVTDCELTPLTQSGMTTEKAPASPPATIIVKESGLKVVCVVPDSGGVCPGNSRALFSARISWFHSSSLR